MSIFIEQDECVTVSIHYSEHEGKTIIHDEPGEGVKTINMVFRRPNFAVSQQILAMSTTTDMGGNPTINLMMVQNNLMYMLAKSWDVTEADTKDAEGNVIKGKPVEFNSANIGKLKVEIARAAVNKLVESIGQIM